jgi:hypothetical protein
MKRCPTCNHTYLDENLSFCLADGSALVSLVEHQQAEPPPTVIMDFPRQTNDQYTYPDQYPGQMSSWQASQPAQPMPPPVMFQGQNQTLPTISLILGIFGLILICCYGGIPFGLAAAITGYLGMQNSNNNPSQYGGRNMAIAGMILGGVSFVLNILFIFLGIIGKLLD